MEALSYFYNFSLLDLNSIAIISLSFLLSTSKKLPLESAPPIMSYKDIGSEKWLSLRITRINYYTFSELYRHFILIIK